MLKQTIFIGKTILVKGRMLADIGDDHQHGGQAPALLTCWMR